MSAVRRLAQALRPQFALSLLILPVFCACSSVPPAPLDDAELSASLEARDPRLLADTAELSGLQPLALARPTIEELADPSSEGFWRGCALVWNPSVRAARRELSAVLAGLGAAGAPGALEIGVENEDFDTLGDETKIELSFDLLGILGLGPSDAARVGAQARVSRSRSAFERALWSAEFEVRRARVRVAAAQARLELLDGLLTKVAPQEVRLEILERRGRLSEIEIQKARLALHEIEHAISTERSQLAGLRAELARNSGLLFGHPALSSPDSRLLQLESSNPRTVDAQRLLANHPQLRELRSEYALAEATLREIAAQAWPSLRVGPSFRFLPSDVIYGGMLDLALPWPGSVKPRVQEAAQQREAAREKLEDALLAARNRVESLRTELTEARLRATDHSVYLDATSSAAFEAATQRLHLGQADYFEWTMRLRDLQLASLGLIDERLGARLLELDLEEACGVRAQHVEVAP